MVEAFEEMLCITFNQDYSCFAIGTENGFKIFNTFPFKDSITRSNNILVIKQRYGGRNRNNRDVQ